MSSISYSARKTIEEEIEYLGRRLDKYAKFYWRGEDMWATYHTFITNDGKALKFINGPSFSNEYSSPQYDHAMGNLTGVKFTRMKVSFNICTYGVTAEQYRKLIAALGPYEVDYLSFDYDDKLCYLVKTTGMREGAKTIIGVNSEGKDLYMVENSITFEVQGEQCALAQRQYVWTVDQDTYTYDTNFARIDLKVQDSYGNFPNDLLISSEKPFGVVGEIQFKPADTVSEGVLEFCIVDSSNAEIPLCSVTFNKITSNWQNTEVDNNADQEQDPQPTSFQPIDSSFLVKYDSTSGLFFLSYGETDYKILNLLLANTYGDYLVKSMASTKMKIDKNEDVSKIVFRWKLTNLRFMAGTDPSTGIEDPSTVDSSSVRVYGRAKAILV